MAESAGTTNPMKVGIWLSWEIKVDHNVHWDDVDTSSKHIRRNKTPSFASLEVMEDPIRITVMLEQLYCEINFEWNCWYLPISISLVHSGVNKEAWVAELTNFASQQFDTFRTVTKDDCLRDIELGEESVEAVQLLTFFKEGIVLSQAFQSEFISDLDVLWLRHISLLKLPNFNWISRTEETDLAVFRHHF